ncbi:D-tagatose 3-epimerase [Glaciihabitans tibetensis]|uniref:D-tagatose 3-epimerase n=1 Tax=Glaciihabitans tibetensis TaxID=1266600 RepID=A0A2T0V1S7_9MICO|nr:sugar phosphate isomerase/epimerase [Glaciihabitans tibetensis]PRY64067.1 D-tagatose 3-epimerase [Glaciihabitans tibetensis]
MLIGCHGLVWTGTFDEAGFDLAVGKTLDAGFTLLEIPLLEPESFGVEAAKRSILKRPIAISASLGQSADTDISSTDPDIVAAGERKLMRALEILSELESEYFVGVLYSQLAKYPEAATAVNRSNSVEVLRRVAVRAQELGITLGLEVVNRYETNLFNTAKEALVYLDEIDHPNIGVHLDSYHMNIEESDMVAPVLLAGDRLVYVHIGESHRGYLGSGSVDFDGLFRALALIGYSGPIAFESFSTAVVSESLSRSLAVWRNLWTDSEDLGAHANAFIRNKLRAVESIALH